MSRSLFLIPVVLLVACAGKEETDTGVDDTDSPVDTDTDVPAGSWDECTEITLTVPEVTQVEGTGNEPVPEGGLIADGTYVLTAYEVYGASVLTSDRPGGIRAFSAPGLQILTDSSSFAGPFSTAGSTLAFISECDCTRVNDTCSDALRTVSLEYTATGDTFLAFSPYINGGTSVSTYTRQ